MIVIVKVSRFDPSVDKAARFDEFHVPIPDGEKWTVMDVMDYICLNLDSSVSYYRHSACDRGICARCAARVNGKVALICQCLVPSEGELVVEPVKKNVVKDIVCK